MIQTRTNQGPFGHTKYFLEFISFRVILILHIRFWAFLIHLNYQNNVLITPIGRVRHRAFYAIMMRHRL